MHRTVLITITAVLAVLSRTALAQSTPDRRVEVVTVCDVLSDPTKYAGATVLLVARMESSVSIDRYDWFSQDGCERHVTTRGGRTWPDRIDCCWDTPPDDNVEIDDALVRSKLALVKKTTQLGSHKEPHAGFENGKFKNWGTFDEPNQWVLVYGRIVAAPNLGGRDDCGDLTKRQTTEEHNDCFGFRGAPLGIAIGKRENIHRLEPVKCCQP